MLQDLGELLRGHRVEPMELYALARKSLHFVGLQGLSQIAVSGLDMAAWDALAERPVFRFASFWGSIGAVKSYNSNGLWLQPPAAVANEAIELMDEGGFTALKLRLGRDRLRDDLATVDAVRAKIGYAVRTTVDFNQGLSLGEALERCHLLDDLRARMDRGAYHVRQPRRLCAVGVGTENTDSDR